MKTVRILAAATLAASMAASVFAALSSDNAKFGTSPAQFLMTKEEQARWKTITTDAEAKAFIDLFWARRDPTPGTPKNEFREGYEQRVKVADQNFAHGKTKGSLTDRGHVFIVLGGPASVQKSSAEPKMNIQTPTSVSGVAGAPSNDTPKQMWVYEQAKTPLPLGQARVEIAFVDQYASSEWTLERTRFDLGDLLNRVNTYYITQPDLTSAAQAPSVKQTAPAAAAAAPSRANAVAANAVISAANRAAIDELRAGKRAASNDLAMTYGEYVTPAGDYFVPVSLLVPKTAGLTADSDLTFFGEVVDANGQVTATYEEPVRLIASRNDFYYDRSLMLTPGKYTGTFGLAQGGKPLSVVTSEMNLKGLDKSAPSVSQLILSNNIYTLSAAQRPTDPFAFGGLKVVPKSDTTFVKGDDVWYFVELRNPAVDASTNAPKLTVLTNVTGTTSDGKKVAMNGQPAPMPAQQLNGVPGHWVIGEAIPTTTFRPGDYTISVKLTDNVNNKSYDFQRNFKVVAK
ncbi:MAG TPA: GWxTD domain-containing protein [Thermoanaerobaculia bacterium]|nr:GWxTD domain-containing protein [Thermoanaerobaculia bacterium]